VLLGALRLDLGDLISPPAPASTRQIGDRVPPEQSPPMPGRPDRVLAEQADELLRQFVLL
jgi:hypothetical protein